MMLTRLELGRAGAHHLYIFDRYSPREAGAQKIANERAGAPYMLGFQQFHSARIKSNRHLIEIRHLKSDMMEAADPSIKGG